MTWKQPISALALLMLAVVTSVHCQVGGVRVPLIKCYNDSAIPGITIANNRLPTNLNVFVELIRRIEDANPTLSMRDISVAILQRLQQGGIVNTGLNVDLQISVPFSTNGLEAYKTTVLLEEFITNTSSTLNYGDLDDREICSLHYIISSTIASQVRKDESTTCTRSARYTLRIRRDIEATADPKTNPSLDGDVDTLFVGYEGRSIVNTAELSQCPIELGVIYTNYGTVKAGPILVGIATGFNQETVKGADNRYAATIAGELTEAAQAQYPNIVIGNSGGWNSTVDPKYYFLRRSTGAQLTDAEIRGSLDGLYMALKLDSWKNKFSDIKISQIVDMYYSPYQKGVFEPSFKACNRNILFTELVTSDKLQTEILKFMEPLNQRSSYASSLTPLSFPVLTTYVYNNFSAYLPQIYTNDLACAPQETIERISTDLIIFIDPSWKYETTGPLLSYILNNVDINKYNSRYSIYNGANGFNVTNSTRYLLDFYKQYNLTVHGQLGTGFDYSKVYEVMESIVKQKLANNTYYGGESTVVVLLTRTVPNENQKTYLEQRKQIIRDVLPDLTVLVLGSGSESDYSSIVLTPNKDFIPLTDTSNENDIKRLGESVVSRIRSVHRAVVNPSCGPGFNGPTTTFSLTQYVEPNAAIYYRISPNYFYTGGGERNLKITENSYGTIQVCVSREDSRPNNATSADCQSLRTAMKTVNINGYCGGLARDCPPIYLAVSGSASDVKCRDVLCRYPDEIKYTLTMENVGCYSSSFRVLASAALVTASLLLLTL